MSCTHAHTSPGHYFIVVTNEGTQDVYYMLNITLTTRAHDTNEAYHAFVERDVVNVTWMPTWQQWSVMAIINIVVIATLACVYMGTCHKSSSHRYTHIATHDPDTRVTDMEAATWPPASSTHYGSVHASH